jgi:phage terminase large subunit
LWLTSWQIYPRWNKRKPYMTDDFKVSVEIGKKWLKDPVQFVVDNFCVEPESWQRDFLYAYIENQRVSMQASKGVGKTCALSWAAWHFMATRPYPKMAATSISGDNLRDGFWFEMGKWQGKSPYLSEAFKITAEKIFLKEAPTQWSLSARQWSKTSDMTQQAHTLSGLHDDYLMFIIDEAGGIPDAVMATAEAGLAGGIETKIIIAGNPTHLEGPLYRAATKERHLWKVFTVNGDPDNPLRSKRVPEKWAREQIEKYGKDNDWVQVNVFGNFPKASINALLGPSEIEESMKRKLPDTDYAHSQKRIGVDVARDGEDSTVIVQRQGLMSFPYHEMRGAKGHEVAARVAKIHSEWNADAIFVDDTGGFGGSVLDSLIQAGIPNIPIHFSGKATDSRNFNKRTEMWLRMADWVKRGGCLPNDPRLSRELSSVTYSFQEGKFRVIEKEQIKKDLGFSPDVADALCLTFAFDEMPTSQLVLPGQPGVGVVRWDYDPLDHGMIG